MERYKVGESEGRRRREREGGIGERGTKLGDIYICIYVHVHVYILPRYMYTRIYKGHIYCTCSYTLKCVVKRKREWEETTG